MKIKVMIDSAADINIADALKEDITVARFALTIDGEQYLDEIDITMEDYKKKLYGGSDILTSQTPLGVLIEIWDEILEDYDHIIYITLSKKLSGAYQSAYAASLEYDNRITLVDTNSAAYPIQVFYRKALEYVEEGKTPDEIREILENHEPMYAHIVPHDIKHLKKGGRISPQAAALANLLKIVPILSLEDGVIDAYDKVRTNKKAIEKSMETLVAKYPNPDDYHWFMLHSDLDDDIEEYKNSLEAQTGQDVTVAYLHPIILTHTGPKTFGVAVLKKFD